MEELKNQITEKTGITDQQAGDTIQVISRYIKERVPAMVHNQLDKVLSGMKFEDSIRTELEHIGNEVKERTEGLAKDFKDAIEGAFKSKKDQEPK